MILIYILIAAFLISLISFIGVFTFFLKEQLLNKILSGLVAFSAGALIGGAFFHLTPEAVIKAGLEEKALLRVFLYIVLGFCLFFVLEQFIHWHHHHTLRCQRIAPFSYIILVSGAVHNFIDGLIIAASFAASFSIGAVSFLAVALHEIPQKIGDFGVLIYGGFKKEKALLLNFLSASAIILGGLIGFFVSALIGKAIIFLLSFAAGSFIYIGAVDLMPEIKHKENFKKTALHFSLFLLGIILMLLLKFV